MNAIAQVALCLPLVLVSGCGSSLFSTDVAELRSHSRDYDGKEVTVRGKVVEAANMMLLKWFIVEDDTGHIYVWTDRGVPNLGDSITVTGTFHQVMSAGFGDPKEMEKMLERWRQEQEAEGQPRPPIKPNTVRPDLMCCLTEAAE